MSKIELPHSEETEQAVLACCLIDEKAAEHAARLCNKSWFFKGNNREIFNAIQEMIVAGQAMDMVSLASYMKSCGTLERVGGLDYLGGLTNILPNSTSIAKYITQLKDLYILRQVIRGAQNLIIAANEPAAVLDVENLLLTLRKRFPAYEDSGVVSFMQLGEQVVERMEGYFDPVKRAQGVYPTGIDAIDLRFAGGLRRGLHTIAGRPHDGKTALGVAMARGISERGFRVWYDQWEMKPEEQFESMVAGLAGGSRGQLIQGKLDSADVFNALGSVANWPILCSRRACTVDELRVRCDIYRDDFDVLFIDQFSRFKFRKGWKYQLDERDYIANELENISVDLDLPIVLLTQLNRNASKNDRPHMSDIKNCGAIEEASDVVWLLHRPNRGQDATNDVLNIYQEKDRIMGVVAPFALRKDGGKFVKCKMIKGA